MPTVSFNLRCTIVNGLAPGGGWGGATAQPGAVGDSGALGYAKKPVARWNVVPFQTVAGSLRVGVPAFHVEGIDRVEFSVDGGPWRAVRSASLNPDSGTVEYWTTFNAALLADGAHEVRSVVYPVSGVPRVLGGDYDLTNAYGGTQYTGEHSLVLYTGADQAVELAAGSYTWGMPPLTGTQADQGRWIVFRPAAGVAKADVVINNTVFSQPPATGVPSIGFKKVKFQGLTMRGLSSDVLLRYATGLISWVDDVDYAGVGQQAASQPTTQENFSFSTNSTFADSRFGQVRGFVRNCTFDRIGENVVTDAYLSVNVSVDGVDVGANDWHPSVFSNPIGHDNRVYYGNTIVNASGELYAFRQGTIDYYQNKDVAVVGCHTKAVSGGFPGYVMMLGGAVDNMLVKDSAFTGPFVYRTAASSPAWDFAPALLVWDNVTWPGADLTWPQNVYIR